MATSVTQKILTRRDQRARLLVILPFALVVGAAARLIRPLIDGPIHYEALGAVVLLCTACLLLLLGLRRIAYRRGALVYVIECSAVWACFAIGWIAVNGRVWDDILAVSGVYWVGTVFPGLLLLLAVQRVRPPRLSMNCPGCNYDLRGLDSAVCPECGVPFRATCFQCGGSLDRLDGDGCARCGASLSDNVILVQIGDRRKATTA